MVDFLFPLIESFNILTALLIFLSYVAIDGLYAYYTLAVVELKEGKAGLIGAFMHVLLAYGVINFVQNYLYLIPLVLGSFVGTVIAIKIKKRQAKRKHAGIKSKISQI